MYGSCLHFLHRRNSPFHNFLTNSFRSDKFLNSFINGSPTNRSQLKYFDTNLLIPNQIESPTCLQKQIRFFPITFCTVRLRPNKHISLICSQKHSNQRLHCYPYWNHMTSNSIMSSRCSHNTVAPKRCSPTNETITLLITSKNTSKSQNTQRYNYCKRNSRNSDFGFSCITGSIKNCNQYSKRISTCQSSNCHQNKMTIGCTSTRGCPRKFKNSIFTIISSQKRPSQKTQTSLKLSCPCLRQSRMTSSRTSHILYIRTSMNNHTCTLKKKRFKTSVSHQMIHCKSIMTQRKSNHHITQLTTCTISNHTFHIILNQSHCSSHQRCYSSYPQQYGSSNRTIFPNSICSSNLKNTCSYQCCRMNLSRYWCWTFHSICQPNMLSNLCTFSLSTTLQSKSNPIRIICCDTCGCLLRSISTSQIPPTKKKSQEQNCITDTIYLHCFLSCFCSTQTMKPKPNLQITTNTNHFPTNHKCQQIICCYLLQHRSSKLTQITQKSRQMCILLHISHTINMHTKTYCTDCYHHGCTESVKTKKPIHIYCMCIKPITLWNYNCRTHRSDFIQNSITQKSTGT